MKPAKLSTLLTCFAVAALLAFAAAGCGGGDDGDSTAAKAKQPPAEEAPTQAQLISEGDAICGEVNAAVGAATAGEEGELGEGEIRVAELYIGMVDSIKEIGEPQPADGYDEFIEAAEALSQAEADAKLAAERGETSAAGSATTALEEFQSQAAIYGFEDCAEEASAPVVTPGSGDEAESEGEVAPEEGAVEVLPEEEGAIEEVAPEEEIVPEVEEEVAPEGGGAGIEEVAPEEGGGTESGGTSGGVGPG